jgi:glycogen synthase
LKILALSNLYPPDVLGGYELACAQVVDALRGRGHDVQVLTAAPRTIAPSIGHVHRRFKLTEDRFWLDPSQCGDDAVSWLRVTESRIICAHNVHVLSEAIEQFEPDVVYLNNLVGIGGLGLVACLQHLGAPWVWHLGDCVPLELCRFSDDVIPELAREFNRSVRGRFIAVSRQLCEEIRSGGVILKGSIEILPYWITGKRPPARDRVRRGSTLRIMSTGRVHREKGIDLLIESAARLRDEGRDNFLIDIYGEVADPAIPNLIRKHDVSRQVTLMGPRPHRELLELYGEYDVFAFPTREREPFGIVPLEALARGCVPVITRRCGVAEWLVHGVHCLKAARTAAALAEVFRQVIEGEVLLDSIARRGEEAAWRDFHLDTILPRIERSLYEASRSNQPYHNAGSAAEAYRLARIAESLVQGFVSQGRT